MWKGARTMSSCLPACTLKKSRKLDTVESRMEPEMRMVLVSSRCSSSRGVSRSISALARQPLSGVRTSWHMSDMNSLLASFAAFSFVTTSARCAACRCTHRALATRAPSCQQSARPRAWRNRREGRNESAGKIQNVAHLFARGGEVRLRTQMRALLLELFRMRRLRQRLARKGLAPVALDEPRHDAAGEPRDEHALLRRARHDHRAAVRLHARPCRRLPR